MKEEDKKDCFAWLSKTTCNALKIKKCLNCSFYKNKKFLKNYEKFIDKKLIKKEVK